MINFLFSLTAFLLPKGKAGKGPPKHAGDVVMRHHTARSNKTVFFYQTLISLTSVSR